MEMLFIFLIGLGIAADKPGSAYSDVPAKGPVAFVGDRLLVRHHSAIYSFDAQTGRVLARYPFSCQLAYTLWYRQNAEFNPNSIDADNRVIVTTCESILEVAGDWVRIRHVRRERFGYDEKVITFTPRWFEVGTDGSSQNSQWRVSLGDTIRYSNGSMCWEYRGNRLFRCN